MENKEVKVLQYQNGERYIIRQEIKKDKKTHEALIIDVAVS